MKSLVVLFLLASSAFGADWVKLFDGKTLKGWAVHSGTATYVAEKGEIVGTAVKGSANSFLCTEKEYGDFILEFEVNVGPELNSGVQFRSQIAKEAMTFQDIKDAKGAAKKIPADRVYGYQAEIAIKNAGSVYDEARRAVFLDAAAKRPDTTNGFKASQWNKYKIECKGDSIKTWVNGVMVAEFKDSMTLKGIFGLQVHGISNDKFKPYQVRWRNLRLKQL